MSLQRGSSSRWYTALALAVGLLAGAALATSAPSSCNAACAGSLSKQTQECMKKCPSPAKRSKRDDYQLCAQSCSERFNREYAKCSKDCAPKPEHSSKHHKPKRSH